MAINIAYNAMPSAFAINAGKILPAIAPKSVPVAQPIYGSKANPKKYLVLICCGLDIDTAKISSVIKAEHSNLFECENELSVFCDSVKLIKKYLEFIIS